MNCRERVGKTKRWRSKSVLETKKGYFDVTPPFSKRSFSIAVEQKISDL